MKKIIEQSGKTLKEFAEFYEIPYNTVRQWYNGERTAPAWVKGLIEKAANGNQISIFEKEKKKMKQRYNIIQIYFGKFDNTQIIACTDDLMHAVIITEQLNKASEGTCYTYNFQKIHNFLDPIKDFYPGKSLFSEGTCLNCKDYNEYLEQKEEWNNQKN